MVPRYFDRMLRSVIVMALGGCATVDPAADYDRVAGHVQKATGSTNVYRPGDDKVIEERVRELLDAGITADGAVEICLLNNPLLQAAFMDVGMARADLVQAGLLSNPFLGVSFRLPSGGGLADVEANLAQNIAELWQIPVRKRAAERSLDRAVLDLARQAADLAGDAKAAYFFAVGSKQRHKITQENLAVARELLELTLTRQRVGAANELEVNLSRGLVLEAELAVESARLAAADSRRELAIVLGLKMDADKLVLLDTLPEAPDIPTDAKHLIDLARLMRLDIQAAAQAVSAAKARLEEQYRRVFPLVEIGVALERAERKRQGGRDVLADAVRSSIGSGRLSAPDIQPRSARRTNTDLIVGPSLGVELPIFDQNQAQIARALYAYEQARRTLDALDRSVSQEVRGVVDRALTAWRLAHTYRDRSLPLTKSNLDLSREAYRAGRASFLTVLEAQRFFLDSRSNYVLAWQSAAVTVSEMERTIGLPFHALMTWTLEDSDERLEPGGSKNGG